MFRSEQESPHAQAEPILDQPRRGVEALVEGDNIDVLRPGKRSIGMHPRHLDALRGRRAVRHIPAGEGIRPGDVLPPIVDA
jgi:sialic acid synthase SpsE